MIKRSGTLISCVLELCSIIRKAFYISYVYKKLKKCKKDLCQQHLRMIHTVICAAWPVLVFILHLVT